MRRIITVVVITAVLAGGGAFYGGMKYAQSKVPQRGNFSANFQRNGAANIIGGTRANGSGGFTAGDIVAKDNNSITVKLSNGSSKVVFFSDTIEVDKFAKGTASDLQVGESVTVGGQANQDGSITAQTIQIRPSQPPAPAGQ